MDSYLITVNLINSKEIVELSLRLPVVPVPGDIISFISESRQFIPVWVKEIRDFRTGRILVLPSDRLKAWEYLHDNVNLELTKRFLSGTSIYYNGNVRKEGTM